MFSGRPREREPPGGGGAATGHSEWRERVRLGSQSPLQAQPSSQGFAGVREMGSRRPWKAEWERSQAGATEEAAEDRSDKEVEVGGGGGDQAEGSFGRQEGLVHGEGWASGPRIHGSGNQGPGAPFPEGGPGRGASSQGVHLGVWH